MSWVLVIALAAAALALAVLVLRIGRGAIAAFAAALALGLAGYALQARPDVPAAPAAGIALRPAPGQEWRALRQEMIGWEARSDARTLITADAFAARGDYVTAAGLLRIAVQEDPRDGEAWLALANSLVEHADGLLTAPARLAYARAAAQPGTALAAGYFLGLNQLRGGDIIVGRETWVATLAGVPPVTAEQAAGRAAEGADARVLLVERLDRLDQLLAAALQAQQVAPERQ
ncbi:tetratricopeptide repeat protein [Croceibacterium ferulae]|uniref:tetratricopeptide repeat protein n=1 Tax=Croceibacterium ferulae TaxID=1854641 RepID=UPI0012D81230|nr:tetratricopeptide repeat protein [Croceibacterium ferulae]